MNMGAKTVPCGKNGVFANGVGKPESTQKSVNSEHYPTPRKTMISRGTWVVQSVSGSSNVSPGHTSAFRSLSLVAGSLPSSWTPLRILCPPPPPPLAHSCSLPHISGKHFLKCKNVNAPEINKEHLEGDLHSLGFGSRVSNVAPEAGQPRRKETHGTSSLPKRFVND